MIPSDRITFSVDNHVSGLTIKNNSPTKNIVYKIRTTQPLCYVVKPNSGIIEAMSESKVEINYVPNTVSQDTNYYFYSYKGGIHKLFLTLNVFVQLSP